MSGNYAQQKQILGSIKPVRKTKKAETMKQTLKQRIRNWLMDRDDGAVIQPSPVDRDGDKLQGEGLRFSVYRASGGFVIECRQYDRIKDRHLNSIYIVTEEEDLGNKIGQIITMESLR